jgi:hypothetical protein
MPKSGHDIISWTNLFSKLQPEKHFILWHTTEIWSFNVIRSQVFILYVHFPHWWRIQQGFRDVGILLQHCTVSQLRRARLECGTGYYSMFIRYSSGLKKVLRDTEIQNEHFLRTVNFLIFGLSCPSQLYMRLAIFLCGEQCTIALRVPLSGLDHILTNISLLERLNILLKTVTVGFKMESDAIRF